MSFENSSSAESLENNRERLWGRVTEKLGNSAEVAKRSGRGALLALATVMALAPNEGSAQSNIDTPLESLSLEQSYTFGSETYFEDQSLEASYQRAYELIYELEQGGIEVDDADINLKLEGYVPVEINGNSTWDLLSDAEQERVEHMREIGNLMSGGFTTENTADTPAMSEEEPTSEPGMVFESKGMDTDAY